jgi:hypothetical protein
MRKALLILVILITSPLWLYVGYIVLFGGTWWLFGYEQGLPPWKLAEKLVQEHRPAKDCYLYRTTDLGPRPSTYEQQMSCIHEYAKLAKDPSACELLLPGEYGLSCLSTVGGELFLPRPCVKADGTTWVICDGEGSEVYVKIDHPSHDNCRKYSRRDVREWCFKERTLRLPNVNDCENITFPSTRALCETRYAFKLKDPKLCDNVKDAGREKYCRALINTWLSFPALRGSSYFGYSVSSDDKSP